jgi:hypothetical protein
VNTKFRGTATKNNNKKERREHTAKIEEIPIIFLSLPSWDCYQQTL